MIQLEAQFTDAGMKKIHDDMLKKANEQFKKHLIKVFDRALEIQRAKMRADGGYDDQTGNLRSSTGYILTYDGDIVYENFKLSPYGTEKEKGLKEGRKLAKEAVNNEGWGVIFVAGMEYASWVEGRNLTVLTTATYRADESIEQAFKEIGTIS